MRGPPAGPRVLLRRLREIMAEPISAQDRLDKIVTQIAANMVAEVCSVYVLRSDGVLELYATEGLKREAVHQRLAARRPGPGRHDRGRGAAAQPARRADATRPSATCRRPAKRSTTPSSACRSCAPAARSACSSSRTGAPHLLRRGGRGAADDGDGARRDDRGRRARGPGAARHLARPEAADHGSPASASARRRPRPRRAARAARRGDGADRRGRRAGVGAARRGDRRASACSSTTCCRATTSATSGEHRDVLEAYRMFAHDRGWVRRMHEAIRNGLTAEAAVEKVQSDTRARLQRQTDPFLRDRLHDFDDLANRLLRVLMDKPHGPERRGPAAGRDHRRPQHGRGRAPRL